MASESQPSVATEYLLRGCLTTLAALEDVERTRTKEPTMRGIRTKEIAIYKAAKLVQGIAFVAAGNRGAEAVTAAAIELPRKHTNDCSQVVIRVARNGSGPHETWSKPLQEMLDMSMGFVRGEGGVKWREYGKEKERESQEEHRRIKMARFDIVHPFASEDLLEVIILHNKDKILSIIEDHRLKVHQCWSQLVNINPGIKAKCGNAMESIINDLLHLGSDETAESEKTPFAIEGVILKCQYFVVKYHKIGRPEIDETWKKIMLLSALTRSEGDEVSADQKADVSQEEETHCIVIRLLEKLARYTSSAISILSGLLHLSLNLKEFTVRVEPTPNWPEYQVMSASKHIELLEDGRDFFRDLGYDVFRRGKGEKLLQNWTNRIGKSGPSESSMDRVHAEMKLAMYFAINCRTIIPACGVIGISERTCFACDTVFRCMNQGFIQAAFPKAPVLQQPGTHGRADELWRFPVIPNEEKERLLAGDKRSRTHLAQLEEWSSQLSVAVMEEITAEAKRKLKALPYADVRSKSDRMSVEAKKSRSTW